MMVKSGLEFFYFKIDRAPSQLLLPSAKKICPERLNWPGRFAAISEGCSVNFEIKKSRPLFTIIFKSNILAGVVHDIQPSMQ